MRSSVREYLHPISEIGLDMSRVVPPMPACSGERALKSLYTGTGCGTSEACGLMHQMHTVNKLDGDMLSVI